MLNVYVSVVIVVVPVVAIIVHPYVSIKVKGEGYAEHVRQVEQVDRGAGAGSMTQRGLLFFPSFLSTHEPRFTGNLVASVDGCRTSHHHQFVERYTR